MPSHFAQRPTKALLVTTTTTAVAPQYTSAVLMLRSPMLAGLAMGAGRWPSGSIVATADELHLTLCYLGDAAELEPRRAAAEAAIQAMAAQLPPVVGEISGIGRFRGDDGMDAVYASFDSPDLARWLVKLQEGLAAAGFACEQRHGLQPHITLAFVPSGQLLDMPPPWPMGIYFEQVTLAWGMAATDYALGGEPWAMPDDVTGAAQAGAMAAGGAGMGDGEDGEDDEGEGGETATAALGGGAETAGSADGQASPGGEEVPNITGHPTAYGDASTPVDALKGRSPAIWLAKDWQPRELKQQNDPEARGWKVLPHHVKDISGRTVVGIFSVFGNIDSYEDVCMPRSFAKTFRERAGMIHHIWQHDTMQPPIAVIDRLQEVGRDALPADVQAMYPEATGGAEVSRTYLEGPELANWVLEAIAKGAPMQMSYMYDPIRFEYVEQEGRRIRLIYEQRLWETSDVLWGANPATRASKALDALPPLPLDALLGQLERALISAQKAGARNAAADQERINGIHRLAVELGCSNCKGMTDDDTGDDPEKSAPGRESTHAPQGPSLEQLRSDLNFLLFIAEN
jgi:2'-5' RNA ligase